jgi:hypothetical protein
MRNSAAIVVARDILPAQCLLVFAVAIASVALPSLAQGEPAGKISRDARHDSRPVTVRGIATPMAVTSASLRAANGSLSAAKGVDSPTGSIRRSAAAANPASKTVGKSPVGGAIGEPAPISTQKASNHAWYPESHSYLRPYHYKWRYWTPG